MKLNNTIKIILGAIGTVVLGALGSGLWERVVAPLLGYVSSAITTALSSVSKAYSDSIYESAANLYTPNATEGLAVVLLFLVWAVLLVHAIRHTEQNTFLVILRRATAMQFHGWIGIAQAGVILAVLLFLMAKQVTVEGIQSYSFRQMEIARPYVGEHKYAQLRSTYFQMKTKADFDAFLRDLIASAKASGITVPPFDPK
jgi:hypothetical protein